MRPVVWRPRPPDVSRPGTHGGITAARPGLHPTRAMAPFVELVVFEENGSVALNEDIDDGICRMPMKHRGNLLISGIWREGSLSCFRGSDFLPTMVCVRLAPSDTIRDRALPSVQARESQIGHGRFGSLPQGDDNRPLKTANRQAGHRSACMRQRVRRLLGKCVDALAIEAHRPRRTGWESSSSTRQLGDFASSEAVDSTRSGRFTAIKPKPQRRRTPVVVAEFVPVTEVIVEAAFEFGGKGTSPTAGGVGLGHTDYAVDQRSGRPRHRCRHHPETGFGRSHRDRCRGRDSSRVPWAPSKQDVFGGPAPPGEWCGCSRTTGSQPGPVTAYSAIMASQSSGSDAVDLLEPAGLLRQGGSEAIGAAALSIEQINHPGCHCARLSP